MIGKEFGKVG